MSQQIHLNVVEALDALVVRGAVQSTAHLVSSGQRLHLRVKSCGTVVSEECTCYV